MLRAAVALLVLACAASAHAAPPRRAADREAVREAQRGSGGRWVSARAISHYLQARRHDRLGDAAKAVEHLRLAVAYDEESPELRVSLAEALARLGQLDAAAVEARRANELSRTGPAAAEAHVLLGRIAAARRQPEQAIVSLRHAIRIESGLADQGESPEPEAWRLLASMYLEAGDEEAAVRTLEDLAARTPGDGTAFRELGRAFLERRQPGRAERHLRRALELAPRDLEAHRLLARGYEGLRRDAEARESLLAILRADPADAPALLALGRIAVRAGELPQAREWFHRHARASSDRTAAHVRVVFHWLEQRHAAEALAAARAAQDDVGADPRLRFGEGVALQELRRWADSAEALAPATPEAGELFVPARVALAEALSRAGRHAEAERALVQPRAANPDDVRLLTTRANVLTRAGRGQEGLKLLRRAVAERERMNDEVDLPDLYAALADALVRARRATEGIAVLRGAVSTRPRDETLLYALGSAYERAGQTEAGIAQMRALLALNPDHAEALNFVGYSLAEQGVRLDEAERLVRRAVALKPRSGHILDSLGWVLFRRGEYPRAVEVLEQAERLAGPDSTILEHLGDAYRAVSRPADAVRAYERALASVADEHADDRGRRRATLERKLRELLASAERPL
jgi:tetratricopeptide (TPR) repeat protein